MTKGKQTRMNERWREGSGGLWGWAEAMDWEEVLEAHARWFSWIDASCIYLMDFYIFVVRNILVDIQQMENKSMGKYMPHKMCTNSITRFSILLDTIIFL